MSSQTSLHASIRDFVFKCRKKFKYEELRTHLQEQGIPFESDKIVLDILEFEGLVFSTDFIQFQPRHLYFRNAQFILSPTDEELTDKYLIPGHRFLPFLNPAIAPWKVELQGPSSQPVPLCRVQKRVLDLYPFHSLFSRGNPHNRYEKERAGGEEGRMVEVEAFDLAELIKRWNMKRGWGLLATVVDWVNGIYRIEPLSRRKRQSLLKAGSGWIQALEKGFQQSFDDLDLKYPIEEQIAYAYYYAGRKVLTNPPIHLGGFIESSSLIHFVDAGLENRLWYTPHAHTEELELPTPSVPTGASKSMNEILRDIGVSLEESSIEAYIRDAFYQGNASPEQVLNRIFAGREALFYSQEQMESFLKFFDNLWKRVKRSYNPFTDRQTGAVRAHILRIIDQYIAWLRGLDRREVDPKLMPKDEFHTLVEMFDFLEQFLQILNRKNPGTEAELSETQSLLPAMEQTFQEIQNQVEAVLQEKGSSKGSKQKASSKPQRRTTRGEKPGNGDQSTEHPPMEKPRPKKRSTGSKHQKAPHYVLKVQLDYIRPPIWRRIQVPGTYTLRNLHQVIQTAMGWEDYHLYLFRVGQQEYGPPEMEDPDVIPDKSVRLDDMGLQPKKRFLYTYDFGDNWDHTITVEKVLPPEEVPEEIRGKPVCLEGERACPPEDCGGYPGYEEILEALQSPAKKKNREILEWVGDFDPEHFDLQQVNKKLAK
ncbi:MAG: hypothetical protein Kow009_04690 [Spirochaetales bacterium]